MDFNLIFDSFWNLGSYLFTSFDIRKSEFIPLVLDLSPKCSSYVSVYTDENLLILPKYWWQEKLIWPAIINFNTTLAWVWFYPLETTAYVNINYCDLEISHLSFPKSIYLEPISEVKNYFLFNTFQNNLNLICKFYIAGDPLWDVDLFLNYLLVTKFPLYDGGVFSYNYIK